MWKDKLVLVGIANNILQCKSDLSKQKRYAINLESNNFKNKLYLTVNIINSDDLGYLNSYLDINVNNAQEYSNRKLISILVNYKKFKNFNQFCIRSISTYLSDQNLYNTFKYMKKF